MDRNDRPVEILMAVYNGEAFLAEQIDSILAQSDGRWHLTISDDGSTDGSGAIIDGYVRRYPERIARHRSGRRFGNARDHFFHLMDGCDADCMLFCDQDDVWLDCKVERVMSAIEGGACCVLHNAYITDENLNKSGRTLFEDRGAKTGILHNIIKNCYTGACMALTRQAFTAALPFPANLPMHDQWLGLVSEKVGRVELIDEPLLLYRRNPGSMTGGRTSLMQKIRWRISIVRSICRYKGN